MANVWMKLTRKKAMCYYCKEDIVKDQTMVVVQHFIQSIQRRITNRFHPLCWIEQGEVALRMRKNQVVETRGRKKLELNKEDKEVRCRLLRRHATVVFRQRQEVEDQGEDMDMGRIIAYGTQMNQIREEIALVGGVPKSWD